MNHSDPSPAETSAEATPPATSIWARLFNVLAAPDEVFAEVKVSPPRRANWLLPALLLLAIGVAGGWLVARDPVLQHQQREIQDQALLKMAERFQWSEQQLNEQRVKAGEQQAVGVGIGVLGVPLASVAVATFWWALVLWLVGTKALGGQFTYGKALEAAGLTAVIEVLNKLITPLLQLALGTVFAAPTLALAVVKDFRASDALHLLLASVNVLDWWGLAVSALAVARFSNVAFSKALAWLLGIWLAWKALLLGLSLMAARLFGG